MATELRVLGCGDAFGSGGRFNTCFQVIGASGSYLIDCGASSMVAIRRFGVEPNDIHAVFITHLHGDHFGGLPFFILDAQLVSRRKTPLTIAGPPGLKVRLETTMEALFPGSTGIERKFELRILELAPRERHGIEGACVTPYIVKHACGAPPFSLRVEVDGRLVCYSGDTEWTEGLAEAARGVDLFIAEAYVPESGKVRFHLDFETLVKHLPSLNAKRTMLTHLGPAMLARARDLGMLVAEDGLTFAI